MALSIAPFAANIYLPLSLGSVSSVSGQSYVELNQEGESSFFYTDKETINDALVSKGIDLDSRDRVEPALDSRTSSGINKVSIIKARPVIVHDGNEIIFSKSAYISADEILKDLEIELNSADIIKVADPLDGLILGAEIFIDRAPAVSLQVDGLQKTLHTRAKSVSEVILEQNIVLGVNDKVYPTLDTKLSEDMTISVVRVSQLANSEILDIPFSVEYKDDPSLTVGQSKVERAGVMGRKQVDFNVVMEDGKVVSKTPVSENIISAPVSQIVLKGTKPKINLATGAYADLLNSAAQKYGVDAARMSRLMYCESKGNANAVGGGGKFHGLFQYMTSTWAGASAGAGYGGASIYSAEAQIYTTAWKISIQGYRAWPTCGSR
ncbi:DUF348 domain-containing protein [bacterium]|nr:DUF348 domain-containing protein [bacterium]